MTDQDFGLIEIPDLEALGTDGRDVLSFGVIGFNRETIVEVYNATEAQMAGLDPSHVIGSPFFEAIAQCMNNFMVAQRFEDEPDLDVTIPYILTLRMRPTRVRLRLLASSDMPRRYILVQR